MTKLMRCAGRSGLHGASLLASADRSIVNHTLFARALGDHTPWDQPMSLAGDVWQEACTAHWRRAKRVGGVLHSKKALVLAIGQGDALRWLLRKKAGQTLYCREAFHQAIQESSVSPWCQDEEERNEPNVTLPSYLLDCRLLETP